MGATHGNAGVRTRIAAEIVAVFATPVVLAACAIANFDQTALLTLVVVLASIGIFFASYEASRPRLRDIMPTVVLAALAAAGRILFAPIPDFKPVSAIAIIAGVAFGRKSGFMVGALAALASNFFFGQGPWTPWQMFSFGIIGFLAGIMFQKGILRKTKTDMCVFGFLVTFVIYGGIMNPASVIMWQSNININMVLSSYVMGMPFDFIHAVSTVFFLFFAAEPMLEKLERIKIKYGLIE